MSNLVLDRPMIATEVAQKLEAIQNWPHWGDIVQGTVKEYHVSREDVEEALPEYQRFLTMIVFAKVQLSMFSASVDRVWHAHILNTQRYRDFCNEYIGWYVDHVPVLGRHRDCLTPPDTCSDKCNTKCDTCKQPIPKGMQAEEGNIEAEVPASVRFRRVYLATFGEQAPAIWNLPEEEVDGVAVPA